MNLFIRKKIPSFLFPQVSVLHSEIDRISFALVFRHVNVYLYSCLFVLAHWGEWWGVAVGLGWIRAKRCLSKCFIGWNRSISLNKIRNVGFLLVCEKFLWNTPMFVIPRLHPPMTSGRHSLICQHSSTWSISLVFLTCNSETWPFPAENACYAVRIWWEHFRNWSTKL